MPIDLHSGAYGIFRDAFRKFVSVEILPYYEEWEAAGSVPRSAWKKCGENGFLCPWADEKFGGSGADFGYSAIMGEELAWAGAQMLFVLHSDIVVPYIGEFGSEEQKSKWLPGCTSGDVICAVAMTEPDAGSDLASIRTVAVKDGDHYIINGVKTLISSGATCDLAIVACKTDPNANPPHKGVSLILVEDGRKGFIKGRKLLKMGLRSQDTSELFFEDCRVPQSNLLGVEGSGFKYLMMKLQQERLVNVIMAQCMAERILKYTIEYCKGRNIFGKPISEHQHNMFKIAEMATEIELGRVFVDELITAHVGKRNINKRAAMAKFWIAEMANRVAYHCLQLHGGYGYIEDYPICRDFKDVRIQTIWAGTSEVMKTIIAREVGI
ncbi:MAG: acyl-CoA dehydrogenase family protein [Syntrophales bacterium]|nr:acyl-CoA dehydrogenase family protein [Syntrophales bacterium]HPL63423.1 acyl-CoA dehydrogenase family protein [Syntrophales bacterium]